MKFIWIGFNNVISLSLCGTHTEKNGMPLMKDVATLVVCDVRNPHYNFGGDKAAIERWSTVVLGKIILEKALFEFGASSNLLIQSSFSFFFFV